MYNGRDGVVTDDNGLIYMRARYYSPELRRFINSDIIAGKITNNSFNRLGMVHSHPNIDENSLNLNYVDEIVAKTLNVATHIVNARGEYSDYYEYMYKDDYDMHIRYQD